MAQRSQADLDSLRDYALEAVQGSSFALDPQELSETIKKFYQAGDLFKNNRFVHDNVLFHAGVSFRVSDAPDGEKYGLQNIVGQLNKKEDDTSEVVPFTEPTITHKQDYKKQRCAHKPLRETHIFFNIDTQITYRKGKTEDKYEYPGESERVQKVMTELKYMMEFLFSEPEGIRIWLVPVKPKTWGVTVDNILRAQGGSALIPYHSTMSDVTELKAARINRKHIAQKVIQKDPYAFRMPQTMEINTEENDKLFSDPKKWIDDNIYSMDYATRIGVRRRYKEAHVLVYMANTHIIIKHYDRIQVDLPNFREAINSILRPFYQELGHRRKNVRHQITEDKGAFIRYTLRDQSLINDWLSVYIRKAKLEAASSVSNDPETEPFLDDDFEIPDAPDVAQSSNTLTDAEIPTGNFFKFKILTK